MFVCSVDATEAQLVPNSGSHISGILAEFSRVHRHAEMQAKALPLILYVLELVSACHPLRSVAGHGAGKPTTKIIAEAADSYAFAAKAMRAEWQYKAS